jgi:phosphate transport system substrate-binding protein
MKRLIIILALALAVGGLGLTQAQARDQIRIVGSSTVYPFASYVAEEFGKTTSYPTPVVESTGSGGGLKLFCESAAMNTPDISNASRRIKVSEFKRCQSNDVAKIHEVTIGYDGIAIAQNVDNKPINLTLRDLTLAVAAEVPQDGKLVKNPYTKWNQINSDLPDRKIVIYGPPTTSGTRDAFEELVMEAATDGMNGYDSEYTKIRQDGVYVPSGENDNLIVQRLAKNEEAFGIFGYSFLAENTDRIQGASIEGVEPQPARISSGEYPISRSLYFYVKLDHMSRVPAMEPYVDLFLSEKMIGPRGYLKRIGLIPLPDKERGKQRQQWQNRATLKVN